MTPPARRAALVALSNLPGWAGVGCAFAGEVGAALMLLFVAWWMACCAVAQ